MKDIKELEKDIEHIRDVVGRIEERIEMLKVLGDDKDNSLAYISKNEVKAQMEILDKAKEILNRAEMELIELRHKN